VNIETIDKRHKVVLEDNNIKTIAYENLVGLLIRTVKELYNIFCV
jgi:hypothetical protein